MARKTLLVGWDAADWKVIGPLLDSGCMPVLSSFLEEGVMADLTTLDPVLSPILWNSIATGKRADEHGILGFTEVNPVSGVVQPVTSTSRTAKALWNILSQEGLRTNVVGWFGSHPAEPIRGVCVSDAYARTPGTQPDSSPLMPGTVHPDRLAETLGGLRVHPSEIDATIVRHFIPRAAEIDQSKPNLLPALCKVLAESFSIHAAATHIIEHDPWDFMAVYYIGIDHFSHSFMNFHPPKPDWIPADQFELYRDVVSGGYRLMDLFLGRLLELAEPDTNVVLLSDHGFHSDHLRPRHIPGIPAGPCEQHRRLGILAMKGEGIRRDERIYGVNLLDIAPTVLALFGSPAGADMPGRVLIEAFEESASLPDPPRIPSWELMEGESGAHNGASMISEEDSDLLTAQFVALGYIDDPSADRARAAAECNRERQWNLARVYIGAWRFPEALPLLEAICDEAPWRGDFALSLADCQRRLGLLEEAAVTAERAIADNAETPGGQFVLGNIAFEQGNVQRALEHFSAAEGAGSDIPELPLRVGFAWLKLRRWDDASRAFERALTIDPHSPLVHQGLGIAHLRRKSYEAAAGSLLTSIGYRHDAPQPHYWLGVCLARMGQTAQATQAFQTALSFHPPLRAAHRWLGAILADPDQAAFHRNAARDALMHRREQLSLLEATRQEARHRAIDRAEARRAEPLRAPNTPIDRPNEGGLMLSIVSGLPRSGTSLMMQMLTAAGVPVMTDSERRPDDDNPEGYFEWEEIRGVARAPEILRRAEGRAIKVISALLPALPANNRYKVIFMDRPVEEVAASQQKMLQRRGAAAAAADIARVTQSLSRHRERILQGLQRSAHFETLIVDYPGLMREPEIWVPRIAEFLGNVPEPGRMYDAIRPELYRNRIVAGLLQEHLPHSDG